MENLHGKILEEGKEAIEEHVHVTAEVIFEVSSVGLLCFVSLCLNAVVLITLYRTPRLHNSFNLLVVNLAATDIFNTLFSIPIAASSLMHNSLVREASVCLMFHWGIFLVSTAVVLFSLMLMTINRYYLLVKPDKYRKIFTMRLTSLMAICSWMLYIVLGSLLLYLLSPSIEYQLDHMHCIHLTKPMLGIVLNLTIWLPPSLVLITFCYKTHIYKPRAILPTQVAAKRYLQDAKTLKIILFLLVGSYCCLIPATSFRFVESILPNSPHYLALLGIIFQYLNSVFIPVIYIFVSRHFKKELCKMIRCKCFRM